MSLHNDSTELDDLRAAFTGWAEDTPDPASCPEPDRIWAAVYGELPAEERRRIVDHTAECASCAEEWRLARDLAPKRAAEPAPPGRVIGAADRFRRLRRRALPFAGMAAAAVLLVVVLRLPDGDPAHVPDFRAGQTSPVRSLLEPGEALPKEHCVLRWSGIEDARYDVLVSDADLAVIARGENLEEPRFLVPAEALAVLAAGSELYWRVEAVLPDGSSLSSPTFVHRLD